MSKKLIIAEKPSVAADVARALERLRVGRLMNGYRGRPPGDREAVIDAVMAIAALVAKSKRRRRIHRAAGCVLNKSGYRGGAGFFR